MTRRVRSQRRRVIRAHSWGAIAAAKRSRAPGRKQARGEKRSSPPFLPPEDWHEPSELSVALRVLVQDPGVGFRHVVTPKEVRTRLRDLDDRFVAPLQVVQLSRMTRKKNLFRCYGMQWGSSVYLYPLPESLVEYSGRPPRPAEQIEARMFGVQWEQCERRLWRLAWTPAAARDFYLNNILIHEIGHLLDERNQSYVDRERYAEWFALEYGYKPSRSGGTPRPRAPASG